MTCYTGNNKTAGIWREFQKRIFPYIPALLRLTAYFVKRDRDKCKEIMKVHLEKGNLMSADAYLDKDNVKYAREILKKLRRAEKL